LNTGILEELPLVLPKYSDIYAILFDALSKIYNGNQFPEREVYIRTIEAISEALVYELYFGAEYNLQKHLTELIETSENPCDIHSLCEMIQSKTISAKTEKIMKLPIVEEIEQRLNSVTGKSPRY
jgi:hypothetical protein